MIVKLSTHLLGSSKYYSTIKLPHEGNGRIGHAHSIRTIWSEFRIPPGRLAWVFKPRTIKQRRGTTIDCNASVFLQAVTFEDLPLNFNNKLLNSLILSLLQIIVHADKVVFGEIRLDFD